MKPLRGRESQGCLLCISLYLTGSPPFHHSSFSFVLADRTTLQLIVIFLWLFPVHCDPARLLVASIASPRFQNQNGILMCWGPEPVRFLMLGPMESGSVFLQVGGLFRQWVMNVDECMKFVG